MSTTDIPMSDSVRGILATAKVLPEDVRSKTELPAWREPDPIASLVEALGKLTAPDRNGAVDDDDRAYRYVRLDDLDAVARPILAAHGWAYSQEVTTTRGMVSVTTILMHSSGHKITSAALDLPCPRFGLQDIGAAATYGRRYQLAAILGLPAGTDSDATDQRPGAATATQKQQIWELAAKIWPDLDQQARTAALADEITAIANADIGRLTDTQAALIITQLEAATHTGEEEGTNDDTDQ